MEPNGQPMLMPDCSDQDVFHTPSIVHISENSAFVGLIVETLMEQNPDLKVIQFFKRHFGKTDPIYFDPQGTPWYPEGVAGLVLKKLKFDAENYTSSQVESAVITVPAHFSDPQRKAVLQSAMLADITVLGLVEEPVAAALHYGVTSASYDQVLLVYDFGGGTFDATALSLDSKGVYVLAKSGRTELGGKELDEAVAAMILEQFERAVGSPPTLNAHTLLQLRKASEELKIELCMPGKSRVRRTVLLAGEAIQVEMTKADFEKAILPYLEQAESETMRCIQEAGLKIQDIHALLLVGGSSMVPLVHERLKAMFCHPEQRVLYHEPSKAVAYGAALHASQLSGEAEQYNLPAEFRGVTGHSVGVRAINPNTGRVTIDTVIKKNMPLPVKAKKVYYTTREDQQRIVLDLVQFREESEGLIGLGQLVVGPLPSPKLNYPIEVTVEAREDGTVAVQAYDANTGVELQQVFGREKDGGLGRLTTQRALVRSTFINNV
jgi:molecular chaperone DnaK